MAPVDARQRRAGSRSHSVSHGTSRYSAADVSAAAVIAMEAARKRDLPDGIYVTAEALDDGLTDTESESSLVTVPLSDYESTSVALARGQTSVYYRPDPRLVHDMRPPTAPQPPPRYDGVHANLDDASSISSGDTTQYEIRRPAPPFRSGATGVYSTMELAKHSVRESL